MAMKKRAVPHNKKKANDDTVIYKIMIDLGILCILLLSLQLINRYYVQPAYMFGIQAALGWAAIVFAILAAAMLAFFLFLRKQSRFWHFAGIPFFLTFFIIALSSWLLYATWVSYVSVLYFVYVTASILYMIALLYQHEFFLLSLINTAAGSVFYVLSRIYGESAIFSARALFLNIILILVILVGSGIVFLAWKQNGKWKFHGKEFQLFTAGFSPIPLYISCAVWLACLLISAFLGSVFAYYSVFAAAAFELISAVYYTVKLA